MNSGTPNDDDTSPNITDSSAPDNNISEDNATPFKEENDFELDSEQDDPTGKTNLYEYINLKNHWLSLVLSISISIYNNLLFFSINIYNNLLFFQ